MWFGSIYIAFPYISIFFLTIFLILGFHIHPISNPNPRVYFPSSCCTFIVNSKAASSCFSHRPNLIRVRYPQFFLSVVNNAAIFVDLEGASLLSDTQKWIESIDEV